MENLPKEKSLLVDCPCIDHEFLIVCKYDLV